MKLMAQNAAKAESYGCVCSDTCHHLICTQCCYEVREASHIRMNAMLVTTIRFAHESELALCMGLRSHVSHVW